MLGWASGLCNAARPTRQRSRFFLRLSASSMSLGALRPALLPAIVVDPVHGPFRFALDLRRRRRRVAGSPSPMDGPQPAARTHRRCRRHAGAPGLPAPRLGTAYVESIAGIRMGGRTGLTSVVTAACFLPCFFVAPLSARVPAYATAPVLVLVGVAMFQMVAHHRLLPHRRRVAGIRDAGADPADVLDHAGNPLRVRAARGAVRLCRPLARRAARAVGCWPRSRPSCSSFDKISVLLNTCDPRTAIPPCSGG